MPIEFEEDQYYTGPPATPAMVARAEEALGFRLPQEYVDLVLHRNGGIPKWRCVPTTFPTSWSPEHFEINAILGVGGARAVDSSTGWGSADLIEEWGYPRIGVVVCDLPSGGHDTVMLDYSSCGPIGEPSVAYVDEDRIPRTVAENFGTFLQSLRPCDSFEQEA
jgi:hypothetical protein